MNRRPGRVADEEGIGPVEPIAKASAFNSTESELIHRIEADAIDSIVQSVVTRLIR
jgi:hypothetical protein